MSKLKVVSTDKAPSAIGPYSQAIVKDGVVYISGQLPVDPATSKVVEGGIKEQTRRALENMKAILEEAGGSMDQVVKTTVLMQDLGGFQEMNAVYATYFPNDPPARAAFQVARLPLDVMVEIEAIASIP